MNPNAGQFSIDCLFNGNALHCPGSPLPRSFKPPSHENRACEPLYGLLMAYLPLRTLWRENAPRAILGLSRGILRRSIQSLLGLSSVWVIPAPLPVVLFGAVRRVCAGLCACRQDLGCTFLLIRGGRGTKAKRADFRGVTPYLIL